MYNHNNIFAKILKEEIPCKKIYENSFALAFYDIKPLAKIHALVIPKGAYSHIADFIQNATSEEQLAFNQAIINTCEKLALNNGFRLITNTKEIGGQEVPHYHVHILAGEKLAAMYKA